MNLFLVLLLFLVPGEKLEFSLRGTDRVKDASIRRALEYWVEDLRESPTDIAVHEDAAYAVEQHYESLGFPDAHATVRVERLKSDDGWKVVIRVREGDCHVLSSPGFIINGVSDVSEKELRGALQWKRRGIPGISEPVYSRSAVSSAVSGLRLLYRVKGYLDVSVIAVEETRTDPGASKVHHDLTFTIDVGPRTIFTNFVPVPDARLPLSEVKKAAGLQENTPFTYRLPQQVAGRVKRYLNESGYHSASVSVSAEPGFVENSRLLYVTTRFGEISRFGHPEIVEARESEEKRPANDEGEKRKKPQGVRFTSKSWIRDRLHFERGDQYKASLVEESRRELLRTGLFESVRIELTGPNDGVLRVRVIVTEKDRIRIFARAGFGSYERGRVGVGIRNLSLFGVGIDGRLEARASYRSERVEGRLRYPFLFDQRLALLMSSHYERYEHVSFESQKIAATTAIELSLKRDVVTQFGYEVAETQVHDADAGLVGATVDDERSAGIFASVRRDSRDSFLNPKTGTNFRLRVNYAAEPLGSSLNFLRATGNGSFVVAWADWIRFACAGRAGVIKPLQKDVLPVTERFFRGGGRSVRSFEEERLSPVDGFGNEIGAEAFTELSMELRFRLDQTERFGAALFYDVGTVNAVYRDFGRGEYKQAVGIGLYWNSLIGPIRVDAAVNPDRKSGEDHWNIHFLLGHPF